MRSLFFSLGFEYFIKLFRFSLDNKMTMKNVKDYKQSIRIIRMFNRYNFYGF